MKTSLTPQPPDKVKLALPTVNTLYLSRTTSRSFHRSGKEGIDSAYHRMKKSIKEVKFVKKSIKKVKFHRCNGVTQFSV